MGKIIDLSGQQFGKLTVIERVAKPEGSSSTAAFWKCRCECGTEKIISGNVLRQGKAKSCGCYNKQYHYNNTEDLTNKRFGHLLVLQRAQRPEGLKSAGAYWLCRCDCGNEKIIMGKSLKDGRTQTCGKCRIDIVDDLTGMKFDKLTVLYRDFSRPSNNDGAFWRCKCECGNEITILGKNLKWQKNHSCGCVVSAGEKNIKNILQNNNLNFQTQYTFKDLVGEKGGPLRFDFALLNKDNTINRLIEYQGEQHYDYGGSWFDSPWKHDELKRQYCKQNGYILIYIPFWKRDSITLNDLVGDKYIVDLTDTRVDE